MFKRCFLAASAALLLATAPAASQAIRSPYEFIERSQGLYAYATHISSDRGLIQTGPASGMAVGMGYSIRVSGPFAFDGRLALFPSSRTVYDRRDDDIPPEQIQEDPMVGLVDVGTGDLTLAILDGSLRFNITGPRTWRRIQPYALLGTGAVFSVAADHTAEVDLREDEDLRVRFRNGLTGHFGGGGEIFLSQRYTVRLDARNVFWRLQIPEGFVTPARLINEREWVRTTQLSVGGSIRF